MTRKSGFVTSALLGLLVFTVGVSDVSAARMGGGRSFGSRPSYSAPYQRSTTPSNPGTARPDMPVPVETVTVAPETINEMILAVGDTKAADEAVVFSKVSGKIIDYKVREGDKIQREQVICFRACLSKHRP